MTSYRIGKAPFKSHRSNVGYRGLLHRVFGKRFRIKRHFVFVSAHKMKEKTDDASTAH